MEQLTKAVQQISEKLIGWGEAFILALPNMLIAALIVAIFWLVSRWVYNLTQSVFAKTQLNESLEHLLANTAKIAVIALGVIFALSVLQLQKAVFSMLAGVGVLGLALGFAFQDLVANFVAGVLLAVRAPMRLNDVVEINGIQGTVIDIRIRDTLIRNFDGQDVFIPNKDFMTDEFHNYSSFGRRKIKISVGVDYNADLDQAKKIVLEAAKNTGNILDDPAPAVYVDALGDSSVNLTAHTWIKYPGADFLEVRDHATINVKKALDAADISIPYPTRTLDIRPEVESFVKKTPWQTNRAQQPKKLGELRS